MWNKELKARVLKDHVAPMKDIETDLQNDSTSEDGPVAVERYETIRIATHHRLEYPFNSVRSTIKDTALLIPLYWS